MSRLYKVSVYVLAAVIFFGMCPVGAMDAPLTNQTQKARLLTLKNLILQKIPPMRLVCDFDKHNTPITCMEFSPNGGYLVQVKKEFRITITNSATQEKYCCGDQAGSIKAIACKNEYLISCSQYNQPNNLLKWCLNTGNMLANFSKNLDAYPSCIDYVALHPRRSEFISISGMPCNNKLFMHKGETGEIKASYQQRRIDSIQYNPSGDYFISSESTVWGSKVVLRDGCSGESKKEYNVSHAHGAAWNPDGSSFVIFSHDEKGQLVVFYNPVTGVILKAFRYPSDDSVGIKDVRFSPDGKYCILISCRGFLNRLNMLVLDSKTFGIIAQISDSIYLNSIAVSHNSQYLVFSTDSKDDNMRLHDLQTGNLITKFTSHFAKIIKWRPHSNQFVSVSENGDSIWWDLFDMQTKAALKDLKVAADDQQMDCILDICSSMKKNIDSAFYDSLPDTVKNLLKRII